MNKKGNTGSIHDHLLVLAGGHYWAVGGLAVAAFAIFDRKHVLLAGIVIITLSLLLAASGIMVESVHGDSVARETLIYLIRVHLFMTSTVTPGETKFWPESLVF